MKGKPEEVFPLLCPVREYEWIPGWSCLMRYSESGVAEKNAVFETTEMMHRKVLWTTVTYEPDRFIEYLLIMGRDALVRLSITLAEDTPGMTQVTWCMLFTVMSRLASRLVPDAFSEANFQAMMEKRQGELNRFLAPEG